LLYLCIGACQLGYDTRAYILLVDLVPAILIARFYLKLSFTKAIPFALLFTVMLEYFTHTIMVAIAWILPTDLFVRVDEIDISLGDVVDNFVVISIVLVGGALMKRRFLRL